MTATVLLFLSLVIFFSGFSEQSVDLNLRQLQYVSDHLTPKECGKLIAALYEWSFELKDKKLKPITDNEPCLLHLVDWNKATGEGTTVEDLCLRLTQIGREDIAGQIAQAVYGETSREIHKFFLDNPFKIMAHRQGSRLMEDDEEEEDKKRTVTSVDSLRDAVLHKRFALAVVAMTLTVVVVGVVVVTLYCPASCHAMCPRRLVDTYDAIQESVKETLAKLKVLTVTEIFGLKKEWVTARHPARPSQSGVKPEQHRLVQDILSL